MGGQTPRTGSIAADSSGTCSRSMASRFRVRSSSSTRVGTSVSAHDLRAGDLVFFNTTGVSPSHVGISVGGDEFVHAPNSSGEVRVEHLGARYWTERFVGIRRVE